jgi:hypothetical protein
VNILLIASNDNKKRGDIKMKRTGYYTVICVIMNLFLSLGFPMNKVEASCIYENELSLAQDCSVQESVVYNTLLAQKAIFPEGMKWTDDNYYIGRFGIYAGGTGCAAFTFYLSDAAFGDTQVIMHKDYSDIKVGDILRVYNDTHSVIVLEVRGTSVIVAEGNYNSSIHWGREMSMAEIVDSKSYIMTRY